MAISMYEVSVGTFVRTLNNLIAILEKGAAHAEAKKIDPAVFVNSRLFPDMLPLTKQVQIATDSAKGGAARLAGVEIPKYEDTETTFPELIGRVRKTIAFLDGLAPKQFEGSEDRPVTIQVRNEPTTFKGMPYLLHTALPNFYFHVVTAYDILRSSGVDIGKHDYLGKR
jgi:uncharacterized protein